MLAVVQGDFGSRGAKCRRCWRYCERNGENGPANNAGDAAGNARVPESVPCLPPALVEPSPVILNPILR